jgi:dolichol-phosphate mannosyltransferase
VPTEAGAGTATVAVVIPALNEAANIVRVLDGLGANQAIARRGVPLVFVVDDGSTDDTAEVCAAHDGRLPVTVIRHQRNVGPGAAFRSGFLAALTSVVDDGLIVTLEADSTSDLAVLDRMLDYAWAGADCVLASVYGGGHMLNVAPLRRVLSTTANRATRRMLGVDAHTVSSFFRVYRADALRRAFDVYGHGFIAERGFACKAEILMKLDRLGMRIQEVPVDLDGSLRVGASNMPLLRTIAGYGRLFARTRLDWWSSP